MLLTKRLKIKWLPQNKNYFENIGYEFTKFNGKWIRNILHEEIINN